MAGKSSPAKRRGRPGDRPSPAELCANGRVSAAAHRFRLPVANGLQAERTCSRALRRRPEQLDDQAGVAIDDHAARLT
jgi:hypothetical protein